MSGPSTPRPERAGSPGAGWETELRPTGERYVPDGQPEPTANRAARRAAARVQKGSGGRTALRQGPSGLQEAREAACTPLSRPNSPLRSPSRFDPLNASDSRHAPPPTRTET